MNNVLPPSLVSPQALAIAKLLPPPNNLNDPCGKVLYGAVTQINQQQLLSRVDYQLSTKQSLFGRDMVTTYVQSPAYSLTTNILQSPRGGLNDLGLGRWIVIENS